MLHIILAVFAGLLIGFLFGLTKLPIPAPPTLSGIGGILGIYLGYKIYLSILPVITKL
ncbi:MULTISPECIES: XapX domain-containing protein [Fredinandcohnia]|jgi:XapX domain-containing protein|uniref:XapX domain-containing protein n=1 Tax=Fredinandcohnia salidurans TaxID=2595041 RepID=A0ABW4MPW0_9BACI|nr:XapX domain-containing protein [Fredinandcohnia onubensis]